MADTVKSLSGNDCSVCSFRDRATQKACGFAVHPLTSLRVLPVSQRNALSYFNFMNDEGRAVMAALLPAGHNPHGWDGGPLRPAAAQ